MFLGMVDMHALLVYNKNDDLAEGETRFFCQMQ